MECTWEKEYGGGGRISGGRDHPVLDQCADTHVRCSLAVHVNAAQALAASEGMQETKDQWGGS